MIRRSFVRVAAPLAVAAALVIPAASAKTVKMTAVSAGPPNVSNVKTTKEFFIPEVDKRIAASGQDFKIEWKEAYGSSLASFNEVFEAIEEGIGQLGLILKNFEESKLPLEQYFYMAPFGRQTPQQLVVIDRNMRKKLPILNETYLKHKQVFLGSAATESTDLFTTFPVKKVDDIKGHKIGASGAMGHYLRGTGAVTVNSSMLDSYTSIKNGVYEGYPISVTLAGPYRTYQAAKYFTEVQFGVTATSALTVNSAAWAQLPEFARKIFYDVAVEWAAELEKLDVGRRAQFLGIMKKAGVEMAVLPPEERRRWAKMMPNIAQEWAESQEKKGLPGKLVLKTYMDELRGNKIEVARHWDRE